MGGGVLGTLKVLFGGDTSDFDKAAGSVRSTAKGLTSDLQSLGLVTSLAFGAKAVLDKAIQFDTTMKNIQAVTGASTAEMSKLNTEIMSLGANSTVGAQAAAQAYYDIAGGVADAAAGTSH
jgi:hypothetical protein